MFKFNFHGHTHHSNNYEGHAVGTTSEIIEKALSLGFEVWGFTEHAPFFNPEIAERRTTIETAQKYLDDCSLAKRKYGDKIKIYSGFECEWLDNNFEFQKSLLARDDVDYLILGNHFKYENNKIVWYPQDEKNFDLNLLQEYLDTTLEAFDSGLFKYVAHVDRGIPEYVMDDAKILKIIDKFLEEVKKRDMIVGVNAATYFNSKGYSEFKSKWKFNDKFWKLVAKKGVKVLPEIDFHKWEILNKDFLDHFEGVVLNYNFNLVRNIFND